MYCRNCGNAMNAGENICDNCGLPVGYGTDYCSNCKNRTNGATICNVCGMYFSSDVNLNSISGMPANAVDTKSRTLAVIC